MSKKISIAILMVAFLCNTVVTFASGNGHETASYREISARDTSFKQYSSIISIQPFSLIAGGLDLSYEQRIGKQFSVRLNFGYFLSADPIGYDGSFDDMDGFRGEIQLRRFIINTKNRVAPEGVYIAPYGLYRQIQMNQEIWEWNPDTGESWTTNVKHEASAASGGLLVGAQLITKARVTLDFFGGGGVFIPIEDKSADEMHLPVVNPYKKTIAPRFGFSVGVAL